MTSALTILGGLGVFLFGLRIMSNGLQKMAGNRLRAVLSGLTRNRLAGIFSGFLITCAVQSSSATTVLVVSFANAGLLSLAQAIGLVMGANIGTTVTAWLVALLGFKIKISAFALPIIGFGFPLSLFSSPKARQLSEVMVGFGLLFLGLEFLKDGVPDLKANPAVFEFLNGLTHYGFGSVLIFVGAGAAITVIVQSSSATTAIILAMVAKEYVGLELACALALGANIGTTVTAQLAAIGANRSAKRVAHFHTLFNFLGVILVLPVLSVLLNVVTVLIPDNTLTQVAAFHTMFNVLVTLVLLPFAGHLESLVLRLVPIRAEEVEGAHLKFLESGLQGTPELSTLEARRAVQEMVVVCEQMFQNLQSVIGNPEKKLGTVVDDIKRGEQKTDEMEEEIIDFCTRLAQSATSLKVGQDVARNLEMANDIERIGDHCMNLVLLAERRWEKKYRFSAEAQAELAKMMESVDEFLKITIDTLDVTTPVQLGEAKLLENKINRLRDHSRKSHAKRMQEGEVAVREGLIYLDMMTNMEKIGDYCWNVTQSARQND